MNQSYQDEIQKMGFKSLPVITIGDKKFAGYDEGSILSALGEIGYML